MISGRSLKPVQAGYGVSLASAGGTGDGARRERLMGGVAEVELRRYWSENEESAESSSRRQRHGPVVVEWLC